MSNKIAIGNDHAGLPLKNWLKNNFKTYELIDCGTELSSNTDYPDHVKKVVEYVYNGNIGVLICGSGVGMSIAANKYSNVRAALCRTQDDAILARKHNDANVLILGGRVTSNQDAQLILQAFIETPFEKGRHEIRLQKLKNSVLKETDSEVFNAINDELYRQQNTLELIASENFVSKAVLEAQGTVLTNKYAEGYPTKRYYGGCEYVDIIEQLAIDRAKQLFDIEYVNVQPHSGSQANQAVYFSLLNPGDTILGMSLDAGGHLTHGSSVNVSGKLFKAFQYGVNPKTNLIDMQEVERLAVLHKPKLIIAGGSAYSRLIDFAAFKEIARKIGAYFMVDMAHFAGLVAASVIPSPVGYADVITSTTHKTLRGARGGIIMTNDPEIAKKVNSGIFPGLQGGPLMHIIAGKAVAFKEALQPEFKIYAQQVINNAKALAKALEGRGFEILTGGTDTHLLLVDLRKQKLTGKYAQNALEDVGITCNKNSVPFDTEKPFITSGIRLGTPACTTRGFGIEEFQILGDLIADTLLNVDNNIKEKVNQLCQKFPLYNNI